MISRPFIVKKTDFLKRKYTIIQHKLRLVMRCYTIRDFKVDESNRLYKFKVTRKINGVKIKSKKEYEGTYSVEEVNDDSLLLKLKVERLN